MWQCRGHAAQSEPRAGSTEEFGTQLDQKPIERDQILSTAQAHREAGRLSCGMATALAQRALYARNQATAVIESAQNATK